jgi:hypothetical protein
VKIAPNAEIRNQLAQIRNGDTEQQKKKAGRHGTLLSNISSFPKLRSSGRTR